MPFRASFCDPFEKNIIEMGKIEKDKIMELFENTAWIELLTKMKTDKHAVIHYAPSLEIENTDNRHGLCITAINGCEWDIFYKRPKLKKMFFGLYQKTDPNFITDLNLQSTAEIKTCLMALMNNELEYLDNKIREQTIIAPFTEAKKNNR